MREDLLPFQRLVMNYGRWNFADFCRRFGWDNPPEDSHPARYELNRRWQALGRAVTAIGELGRECLEMCTQPPAVATASEVEETAA